MKLRSLFFLGLSTLAACTSAPAERTTTKTDASGNATDDEAKGEATVTSPTQPTSEPPDAAEETPTEPSYPDEVIWGDLTHGGIERTYRLFIPGRANPQIPMPLVVMLHGCDETAADFASVTGMDAIARREGFVVAYPQQSTLANFYKCWNWFNVLEQTREGSEAKFVLDVIHEATNVARIDETRVFVAGLSAGAALSVILGSCFPERIKGIGVHSGLAFKAANTPGSAAAIMATGPIYTSDQSADGARLCSGANGTTSAFVIHGDADTTVHPLHGARAFEQFRALADYADDGLRNDTIGTPTSATGTIGRDYESQSMLTASLHYQRLSVSGLTHAWSGGASGFKYSDPVGPNASEMMWSFFASLP